MSFLLRQVRFLYIHFILLGLAIFAAHYFSIAESYLLILSGPAIYLASFIKQILIKFVELPKDQNSLELIFLLPIHILYFGLIGFLLKQIFSEKGLIKILTLLILIGFLGFIHVVSWKSLNLYLKPDLLTPDLAAL